MKYTAEHIISELGIEEPILNIYPYGSQVYGTNRPESDHDFIIVARGSMLKNGAFKNNAISNSDRTIQGIVYSRGGFLNAIDTYDIAALESIFLPKDMIVQSKIEFGIRKWRSEDLVKALITKSSASFYAARNHLKADMIERSKRGTFHAIRILMFGQQLKKDQKITKFSAANKLYKHIMDDSNFNPFKYANDIKRETKKLKEI
jgi:hypothetical protein